MPDQRFSLYALYELEGGDDYEHIDPQLLPFDICDGVRLENTSGLIDCAWCEKNAESIGTFSINALKTVRLAIVHRYEGVPRCDGRSHSESCSHALAEISENLTQEVACCLRLIRPLPQYVSFLSGVISGDGSFYVEGFATPAPHTFIPEVHRHFTLRNQDAEDLRRYAPEFLRALRGECFWKFGRAWDMHERGHFMEDEKARLWFWCSSLQAIFTTNKHGHREEQIAKARVKWFLGADTSIYAPGDISSTLPQPSISIADVVDDIFIVRDCLAYGDRIPAHYFSDTMREGDSGDVSHIEVLAEALSFIVRTSLLKILGDGLLDHFTDAAAAEEYWGSHHLTLGEL